jgi:hypothetical protein
VPVRIVDEDFIAKFAREAGEKQVPEKIRLLTQRMLERFKLVPAGFNLMETEIAMLRSLVAGLYDPDGDCFYVVRGKAALSSDGFAATAAHELAHAYRDVDKDYWKRMVDSAVKDEDLFIAVSCLAEGDAQLIGRIVSGDHAAVVIQSAKDSPRDTALIMSSPAYRKYPLYLREMLITRYYIGQAFAAHVFEAGGWKALDAAFDNPPRSTEQILHPSKYIGPKKDEPVHFAGGDPAAALGDGWSLGCSGTAGEFQLRVTLTEAIGRKMATRATEGWDGGQYFVCEKKAAPMFVGYVTEWDTAEDATEFADAWLQFAARRDKSEAAKVRKLEGRRELVTGDGVVAVRVDGVRVYIADGVPPAKAAAVMSALASAKTIKG